MFNARIILIARILLGIILFVFGLNKFLNFMPPFEIEGEAANFFGALISSGYMFPVIGLIEIVAGVFLLTNRFVPLGLVLMAPVTVNFILFHLFLDPPNIVPGLLVLVLQVYLLFANYDSYQPLLKAK